MFALKKKFHFICFCLAFIFLIYAEKNFVVADGNLNAEEEKAKEQKKSGEGNEQKEKQVTKNLISQEMIQKSLDGMVGAISSRNSRKIKSYFDYYATSSAKFFQKSELYISGKSEIVAKSSITFSRKKYAEYLYEILKKANDYYISVDLKDLKLLENNSAIATVEIEEEYSQVKSEQIDKILKVKVHNSCNISYTYNDGIFISGTNCLEYIWTDFVKRSSG